MLLLLPGSASVINYIRYFRCSYWRDQTNDDSSQASERLANVDFENLRKEFRLSSAGKCISASMQMHVSPSVCTCIYEVRGRKRETAVSLSAGGQLTLSSLAA